VGGDAGYALIDALTALLILSMALVFSLRAASQARFAADQAREVRAAQVLLAQLLETGPRSFEDAAGDADVFSWRVETRSTGADQPIAVCHRAVVLTSHRTKRTYQAATLETCPVQAAA
jgi:hypothetical protein